MLKSIEVSGMTLDAAIEKGLKELGLSSKDEINVKVLKDNGFLFNKFKILVSKKQTEGEIACEFIEELLNKMGFSFVTDMTETEDAVNIVLTGTDSATIIGYRGEVLDAIQYLTSLVANRNKESYKRLTIDTEGYREKRAETLNQLAHNLESKVKRTGRTVKLEPMNPYERRIIHSALQDSEFVTTVSEGVAPMRYVTIVPKDCVKAEKRPQKFGGKPSKTGFKGNRDNKYNDRNKKPMDKAPTSESPNGEAKPFSSRSSLNFVYSSEKKRRTTPPTLSNK